MAGPSNASIPGVSARRQTLPVLRVWMTQLAKPPLTKPIYHSRHSAQSLDF
jgi:hypothetical protein